MSCVLNDQRHSQRMHSGVTSTRPNASRFVHGLGATCTNQLRGMPAASVLQASFEGCKLPQFRSSSMGSSVHLLESSTLTLLSLAEEDCNKHEKCAHVYDMLGSNVQYIFIHIYIHVHIPYIYTHFQITILPPCTPHTRPNQLVIMLATLQGLCLLF